MQAQIHVFNQYYFNVLRQIRGIAREKHTKNILKAIKKHYSSYDKLSDEFIQWFNESAADAWTAYEDAADLAAAKALFESWDTANMYVYKDISLAQMCSIMDSLTIHHLLTILCIFRHPMEKEVVGKVLDAVKALSSAPIDGAPCCLTRLVSRLQALNQERNGAAKPSLSGLGGLENTSIGKMAQEIMDEIDVTEIQKSIGEDGDILKALTNPDNGLMKLVSTVSQKMISKIASGELKQESLLEDAMSFITKSGMGGGGPSGMGDIMKMMSKMGLGGGGHGGSHGGSHGSRMRRMKRKLERRQAKENMTGEVGANNIDATADMV